MTTAVLDRPRPAELNYRLSEELDVIPLDPLTHDPLEAHAVPESLAADPELRSGYDFLIENAGRLRLQILLTAHGNALEPGAHDLGKHYNLGAQLQALGEKKGTLFLESVDTVAANTSALKSYNKFSHYDAVQAKATKAAIDASPNKDTFIGQRLRAITGTDVDVAIADYAKDGDSPAEKALADWWQKLKSMAAFDQSDPIEGQRLFEEWHSSYTGFVAYRNWYMIGKMGAHLKSHDDGESPIDAALLVGSIHATISDEIASLGAEVVTYGNEANDSIESQKLIKSVGSAALKREDINTLNEHALFRR